jgi:hypothetical protein
MPGGLIPAEASPDDAAPAAGARGPMTLPPVQ